MSIPIPRSRDGVAALLDALETDRETVAEADIDEAVYDLFDLTDEERQVIEEYLDVF